MHGRLRKIEGGDRQERLFLEPRKFQAFYSATIFHPNTRRKTAGADPHGFGFTAPSEAGHFSFSH